MIAIEADGLTRKYGDLTAVDHLSLNVQQGEIFGFLGPNGAGKTTTIRMLIGLLRPTSGSARVAGYDVVRERPPLKAAVGVVPERSNLYDELSGLDNLIFMAQLYGLPPERWKARAGELLQEFGLAEAGQRKFASYSRGMRRRLTIAAALVHEPRVLFLDEPTTGLDVMSARGLRQLILRLKKSGITVFLTTHLIQEAEELCDRIAIIVRGRVCALDTPVGLRERVKEREALHVRLSGPAASIVERLRRHSGLSVSAGDDGEIHLLAEDATEAVVALGQALAEERVPLRDLHLAVPSLEDAFIHITGLELDVMRQEKESGRNRR